MESKESGEGPEYQLSRAALQVERSGLADGRRSGAGFRRWAHGGSRMNLRRIQISLLTVCLITAGFAQNSAPEKPQSQDASKPAQADTQTAKGTRANDPDYVIGIEDVIAINVWHEAEMSRSMAVRPDGKISMPLIGEIVADGKTPAQLQAELTSRLQA